MHVHSHAFARRGWARGIRLWDSVLAMRRMGGIMGYHKLLPPLTGLEELVRRVVLETVTPNLQRIENRLRGE